jgi:hypothetical protein
MQMAGMGSKELGDTVRTLHTEGLGDEPDE